MIYLYIYCCNMNMNFLEDLTPPPAIYHYTNLHIIVKNNISSKIVTLQLLTHYLCLFYITSSWCCLRSDYIIFNLISGIYIFAPYYELSPSSWGGGGQYYVLILARFVAFRKAASSGSVRRLLL